MHDTIGCYLDLDKSNISFSKNGTVVEFKVIIYVRNNRGVVTNGNPTYVSYLFYFPLPGNDLGLAFEIPQNLKTQPFFASCVLKVSLKHYK